MVDLSYDCLIDRSPTVEVTVSSKFQVVIPKEAREAARIVAGKKFHVFVIGECVKLVPVRPTKSMLGVAEGMGIDSTVVRDPDREI